jgi:hypothetical protein
VIGESNGPNAVPKLRFSGHYESREHDGALEFLRIAGHFLYGPNYLGTRST